MSAVDVIWRLRVGQASRLTAGVLTLCGTGMPVLAQEVASRTMLVEPSASVTQTLTDNMHLTSEKFTDAVTQLTAALRVTSRSGRVQGVLDYALNGYIYARESGSNAVQNSLSANGRAELVENWLTVNGRASIGQQAVSAFGTQYVDNAPGRANRTEVRTFELTPSIHGRVAGDIDYQASLSRGASRTDTTDLVGNSTTTSGTLSFGSGRGGLLGWNAYLSRRHVDYEASRATEADTANLTLSYQAADDLRLSSSMGREWTNYRTAEKTGNGTWGIGAQWSPSARTQLNADVTHRFYGTGYQVSFLYRWPRSMLRVGSSRDVNTNDSTSPGQLSTAYDLYSAQFALAYPDPVLRDLAVRSFLQSAGINPNKAVTAGFLPGAATLQTRNEVTYSMQGIRSNLAVTASSSITNRLDRSMVLPGDLNNADRIEQRVYSMTLGHRLTPTTGLSLDLSRQSNIGTSSAQASVLRSLSVNLTTSFGQRSTASLAARHVVFDSTSQPYTENAVIATFGLRF